jgi:CHAT domain-containing protein
VHHSNTEGHKRPRLVSLPLCTVTFLMLSPALDAAEADARQLRAAVEQADSASDRVNALWALAEEERQHGRLAEAERVLRAASSAASTEEQRVGSALRLGIVLTAVGRTLEAQHLFDQATAAKASLPASHRVQLALGTGALLARNGDYASAERSFDSAATEAQAAGMDATVLRARINSLRARLDRREIAGLEDRLAKIHELTLVLPRGEEAATMLVASGELHRRAINELRSSTALRKNAYTAFDRAREYAQTDATRALAFGFLGALYEDEGRWEEALRLTSQAVFMAQTADRAEQVYRWEWQAGRIQKQRGDLAQSTAALDRAMVGLTDIRNDVLQSSRQAYVSLVEPVYLDYADVNLRRAAGAPEGSEDQQRALRAVRNNLESLKQAEVQDYFENQCAANRAGSDGAFRVPGTAVIYPILLADRLEVLVEADGTLRRFAAPVSRGQVTSMARQLRLDLERPSAGDAYLTPAKSLYGWLIDPAEQWLAAQKIDTLLIVPSGALRTIPFGALYDGRQFLIERYAIATTPAVSLVSSLDASRVERMLVGGISKSVQGFSELPSVANEIRSISTMFSAPSMQDETFRLDSLSTQLATPDYSVAHLATHGEFNADHRKSFLLTYDSRLTMDALRTSLERRGSSLDLLVLSACKTAAGDDRAALGLAGVAVQAGAKSALASLWYISDKATADLMTSFYQNSKVAGASKAQSLRQAQLALLRSSEYRHPSYWAPYLLIGNWL